MKHATYRLLTNLRGVAALVVVLSHASNTGLNLVPGVSFSGSGRYGVYLFFLLSAFLLTRQLQSHYMTSSNCQRVTQIYLTNRFTRIYPLYVASIFFYLCAYLCFDAIGYIRGFKHILTHLFLIEGNGIFWTIPVEFKFYFVLPFVVLSVLYLRGGILWLIVMAVVVALFLTPQYDGSLYPFVGVFLVGAIVASRYDHFHAKWVWQAWFLVSLAVFVLIIPSVYGALIGQDVSHTFFHPHLWLFCLVFVPWIVVCAKQWPLARLFDFKLLNLLGNISFSLYLLHPLVLLFSKNVFVPAFGVSISAWLFVAMAVVVAKSSHVIFEVRARRARSVRAWSYGVAKVCNRILMSMAEKLILNRISDRKVVSASRRTGADQVIESLRKP